MAALTKALATPFAHFRLMTAAVNSPLQVFYSGPSASLTPLHNAQFSPVSEEALVHAALIFLAYASSSHAGEHRLWF